MNKRGFIFKLIILLFLASILISIGLAVYFYNFFVFKTLRVCVTEEYHETNNPCSSDQDCFDKIMDLGEVNESLEKSPEFLKEKIKEIFRAEVFCKDNTCKLKEVRGLGEDGSVQEIESCNSNEIEIKYEIRGKEAVQILKYLKDNGQDIFNSNH